MLQSELKFPRRRYPSKVLLFGEHTVIMGSGALAIPFDKYCGRWSISKDMTYPWWQPFVEYIIDLNLPFLDLERLVYLLTSGNLLLDIPIGYGLGSSGALTAAIYDFACLADTDSLRDLQVRLGAMESFFHGKSSGYDPLISYLNQGVKKSSSGAMALWNSAAAPNCNCYLIDSGSARVGKDQIAEVQKKAMDDKKRFDKMAALNNQIISSFVETVGTEELFSDLNKLSEEQYDTLNFLLVPAIQELWKSTLDTEDLAMKICGAGGGGYYMLFSKSKMKNLQAFQLHEVPLR